MSGAQRVETAARLSEDVRAVTMAGIRAHHPEYGDLHLIIDATTVAPSCVLVELLVNLALDRVCPVPGAGPSSFALLNRDLALNTRVVTTLLSSLATAARWRAPGPSPFG
jgi:hypothetical protein